VYTHRTASWKVLRFFVFVKNRSALLNTQKNNDNISTNAIIANFNKTAECKVVDISNNWFGYIFWIVRRNSGSLLPDTMPICLFHN
jgi:hypothetical protein